MPQISPEVLAAAQAYRDQLNKQGIRYGEADRAVDAKFGQGVAQIINPHKKGGAAGVASNPIARAAATVGGFALGGPLGAGLAAGATGAIANGGKTKVLKDVILPGAAAYAGGKAVQHFAGGGGIPGMGGSGGEGAITGGGSGNPILDFAKRAIGGADGLDIKDILGLAGAGVGLYSGVKGVQQAGQDSSRARDLVNQAIAKAGGASDRANSEFAAGAPLRDAYRTAALNFRDPSNPFARAAMKAS